MSFDKQIRELLEANCFSKIENLILNIPLKDVSRYLINIAFDTESIVTYSIICMMLIKKETSELHNLAATLLAQPLCHIDGAYSSALCHTRKAISLSPEDINLKEWLLFFHVIPDKLVSDEEAKEVALEILKEKPDSIPAIKVLNPL